MDMHWTKLLFLLCVIVTDIRLLNQMFEFTELGHSIPFVCEYFTGCVEECTLQAEHLDWKISVSVLTVNFFMFLNKKDFL